MSESIRRRLRPARIIGVVVASAFVFGPPIALIAGVQPTNVDNRTLAPPPSLDKGFDALDMISPWATDRLAGRGEAIRTKAWIDYHLLKEMPSSGKVIRGTDGYLFHGDEFTVACKYDPLFESSLESFGKLAQVIERSGKKAVFTLGVNKSSVVSGNLPDAVPAGDCATRAIANQNAILDNFTHPNWVGVRSQLAAADVAGQQPFWRTDTHWTPAGGAIVAREIADHLQPSGAEPPSATSGTISRTGDLMLLAGLTAKESQPQVELTNGATVTPDPQFATYDPTQMVFKKQHWTTSPSTGLVQGKTLILGDSFAYTAMGNLRPLFADGTFLWTGQVSHDEIVSGIKESDTVIIELVQRTLGPRHLYAAPEFRAKVAQALNVPLQ